MSLRLFILGAPGSGKGTQTSRLLKQIPSIQSLSSGDILRSHIKNKTSLGNEVSTYMKNGQLVPDSTMVSLISQELQDKRWLDGKTSWLLDGFPRTALQATSLDTVLSKYDSPINLAVELDVDQRVILQRIEARWVHIPSGRVYNIDYNPPKVPYHDDVTGEPLTKREDDTEKVFQKRLDQYNREIEPLKKFYQSKGILKTVSGNTSDIIFPKFMELVQEEAEKLGAR